MNRRLLLLPLILLAAFLVWRHFQPPRGDRELILGELQALRRAARTQDVSGILSRLDKSFRLQGASKSEIRSQLVGFFWQNSDINLELSGLDVKVAGETATSSGSYAARWRGGPGAPEQSAGGHFEAQWKKTEAGWKIIAVSGVEGLSPQ